MHSEKSPHLGNYQCHFIHFTPNFTKVPLTIPCLPVSHKITTWSLTILASKQEISQTFLSCLLVKSFMLVNQSNYLLLILLDLSAATEMGSRKTFLSFLTNLGNSNWNGGGSLPTCRNSMMRHGGRVTNPLRLASKLLVISLNLPQMERIHTINGKV